MKSIAAYLAQRFPAGVFVPAITLHALAAWWASRVEMPSVGSVDPSWRTFGTALGVMTLLFVQFRLWDDLEDLERDRAVHHDRVLATSSRRLFHILLVMLTVAAGAALAGRGSALIGFGILCTAFLTAYRAVRPRIADARWRYRVLLVKYPAFVGLVALRLGRPDATRLAAAALAAYVGTSLYEAWHHDRRVGPDVLRAGTPGHLSQVVFARLSRRRAPRTRGKKTLPLARRSRERFSRQSEAEPR